jgi:hypothetical protein
MSEAAARLAAATSTSWLDLENFMRIFRQQGHPVAPRKKSGFLSNQFSIESGREQRTAVPGF